jgi:predicted kinase
LSGKRTSKREYWTAGGLLPDDLAVLRAAVEEQASLPADSNPPPATLVILCGLPGTGKSYFARKLAARAPFVWVNSDTTRKLLVESPAYTREEHRRVFAAMHAVIGELLVAGRSVVFDATNLNEEVRRPLYEVVARNGVQPLLVRFTADTQLVRRRLTDRFNGVGDASQSDAGWEVYSRMAVADQPVPRPHLLVGDPADVEPVLRLVLRRTGWG